MNTTITNRTKAPSEHILLYRRPASNFNEALPLGQGRLGAMFYGDPECERIHINEDSVWSGGPRDRNNPSAKEMLPKLRSLLMEDNIPEAERMVFDSMAGIPEGCRHYMPVGDLRIALSSSAEGHTATEVSEEANAEYLYRTLDLRRAVGAFSYRRGGVDFRQTIFCSAPADALIVRCETKQEAPVSGVICMEDGDRRDYIDENRPYTAPAETGVACPEEATIRYTGGSGGPDGISFCCMVRVKADGGSVRTLGNTI
ncbi:MAG: glycoside hydrolase family 95 protein, partial [Lachnospiraceae bacterium]|nr:glycoside hydrolase family 95 protein [Lachnospiraceae bacterium]